MELPETLRGKIRDAQKRLQSHKRWEAWLSYLLPLSASFLIFAIITRFIHIPGFLSLLGLLVLVTLTIAALLALRVKVGDFPAAVQLDFAVGLDERVSTVVEITRKGLSGDVVEALVSDTEHVTEDISAQKAIVFRAPISLPFTLAFIIITLALVAAPRSFGTSVSGLPEEERIALGESMRLATSAALLDEAGASREMVEQVKKASKELQDGKTKKGIQTIKAVKAKISRELEKALQKEAVLSDISRSDALEKLSRLLSEGASEEEISEEAESLARDKTAETLKVLKEIVRRFEKDSDLLRELENAINALEEKKYREFVKAFQDFARAADKIADSRTLRVAKSRLEGASGKLEGAARGVLTGSGNSEALSGQGSPGEKSDISTLIGEPILQEAIIRENVPDRFRNIIKVYFARNNGNGRSEK